MKQNHSYVTTGKDGPFRKEGKVLVREKRQIGEKTEETQKL
jgi:hypothetical protein